MKHAVRIIVTLIILGVTGFSIWFFAFKPSDDLAVFNSLSSLITDSERLDLGKTLVDLRQIELNCNYKAGAQGEDFNIIKDSEESLKFLKETRAAILNVDIASYVNDSNLQNYETSLLTVHTMLFDEVFNYYYSYAQIATGAKKDDQKEVLNAISAYYSSLVKANNDFKTVIAYQRSLIGSAEGQSGKNVVIGAPLVKSLYDHYRMAEISFKSCIKNLIDLTQLLKNYVIKYSFDNLFMYDTKPALFETILNMSAVYTDTANYNSSDTIVEAEVLKMTDEGAQKLKNEKERLISTAVTIKKVKDIIASSDTAATFVSAYNELQKDSNINKVFALSVNSENGGDTLFDIVNKTPGKGIVNEDNLESARIVLETMGLTDEVLSWIKDYLYS